MADKITNDITLLFKTKLDEKSKLEVGKNLKGLLENAVIGFDETETKKNLQPIIRMMKMLFDKAEMAFDADELLGMPSRQALQAMADLSIEQLQTAFDRALAKSGGIKIDFDNVDLSSMMEPLERLTQELSEIGERVANTTKKSVQDIEKSLRTLDKTKKLDKTVADVEKTLGVVDSGKHITSATKAATLLEKARSAYTESIKDNDPWEVQYQHLLTFVTRYEAMTKKIKPIIDIDHPEFKQLYELLSPKADAAKISLEHFVDVAKGNELSEYKNQPWARESTLKKIEQTLKSGISVKGDVGDNRDDDSFKESSKSTPPDNDDVDKGKKLNTKVQPGSGESESAKAVRLAREREEAALREAERKRLEQKRVAEAEAKAAEERKIAEEKAITEARKAYAKEVYRVIYAPLDEKDLSREDRKAQYGGVEIWSSSQDVANTYAEGEEDPVMLRGSISANNAYIIDANGAEWNKFDKMKVLSPTGIDTDGRVKFDEASLRSTFPDLFRRVDNKEFGQDEDIQAELYKLVKELGYDSIITKNVVDTKNPDFYSEPSTIYAVIDDKVLKVLDAFAMEEQDDRGVTTFEEKPRRENIPEYYKMPEVVEDVGASKISTQAEAFKELVDYIGKTGKIPSEFFDGIISDSQQLDEDLKKILVSLGMLDSQGNLNIKSIHDGFSNLGGAVSDAYTLISREDHYLPKTQDLMPKLFDAKKMGANVGEIVDVFEDKVNGRIYELQRTMPGTVIPDSTDVLEATDEQILKLIHDLEVLHQTGLYIDFGGDNILYDKEKGFSFIDLATKPQDGQDTTDGMAQEFLRYTKSFFKDSSFDGFEGKFVSSLIGIKKETVAHQENADAIVAETRSIKELNKEKSKSLLPNKEDFVAGDMSPSDEQKKKVLALGEEYRAILSILEKGDNELTGALKERASAIMDIMQKINIQDGFMDNTYRDTYGGDFKTASELINWQKADSLYLDNYDGSKIDDSERQAVIDLIHREIEARKQSIKVKREENAIDQQQNINTLKSRYESATEQEKALVQDIINIRKEEKYLEQFEDDASEEALDKLMSERLKKAKTLREVNKELWEAIVSIDRDDLGKYIDAPVKTSAAPKVVPDVVRASGDNVGVKDSIQTEELRQLLNSITYNVKVVQDAEPAEDNKVIIDTDALKNVLNNITYKVKIAHDDTDKQANKTAIDESALESTLKRVFTNVLNPQEEQSESEPKNEPWALEKTLLSVKEILGQIQTNTAKPESVEVAPAKVEVGNVLATENTLMAIKTAVESINSKVVEGTKAKTSEGGSGKKAGVSKKNAESYAGSQYFPEKIKTQTMYLAKFRAQLMTTGKLTDDIDAQIYELLDGLKQVQNGPDLSKWTQQFLQLKTSVGIEDIFEKTEDKVTTASYKELIELQGTRNKLELQYEKAQDGSALKQFYAEQLTQIDGVITKQKEILENEEYELKLAKMREEQARKLGETEARAADKDAKKQTSNAKKLAQREAMLGKAGNAVGRAENTWMSAVGIEGKLPDSFMADIDKYYKKLDALRKKHQELKNSDMISEEQKKELIDQTMSVNKMTEEIGELISEYHKLSGDNVDKEKIRTTTLTNKSPLGAYEAELKQYVRSIEKGKAQIKNFDAATKTLTYTVKTGKNEFTEYTAAVRRADGVLVSVQGATKRAETFLEATKRKMKELTSYMSGMALFSRATQELRKGIQYVREIDLALTELRKVTDETEEEYDQFLQTAAKTGARLGTTISAVTEATATFAKLGYSMEQATEMAESAIVYKNVGDNIASTEDAADSIISTMKGFRLEASESMAIVDRFNEVKFLPPYTVMYMIKMAISEKF